MSNYNFREFFETELTKKYANEEYVSNGHFGLKREYLKKTHNNYINTFPTNDTINQIKDIINRTIDIANRSDSAEFIPTNAHNYSGSTTLICDNRAIKEEYYNFIKDIGCRVFYFIKENNKTPFNICNFNSEIVGIVLPVMLKPEMVNNSINYEEHLKNIVVQEQEEEQRKESMKKCLYISDNKAIVRHKELTCIADIINDEIYKNLYVESDYMENFGEVFIDFGFIYMGMGRTIDKNSDIKYSTEQLTTITLDEYKAYITKCFNTNQFINVAEIKLMELAGEPTEYIQALTEHRQKVLDLRAKEHKEREEKRQKEEQDYIGMKNAEADEQIREAEQNIINKNGIKNKDITTYKESRHNSNTTSIINYLMKKYDIKVPLKTQGWINNALAGIFYDEQINQWTYNYYTSSANSTVFMGYMKLLIEKIENKYRQTA
jgi:hypothetical protein